MIPTGFNRMELSVFTRELRDTVQGKLFAMLKGRDVFLLVDGGTLNRKRLLNICIGFQGVSYFHRSIRVPNLTATQVFFKRSRPFVPPDCATGCGHSSDSHFGPVEGGYLCVLCGCRQRLCLPKGRQVV